MKARHLVPLLGFVALALLLAVGLGLNPRLVPSPLVGKPAPEFSLPRLEDPARRFERADLLGQVSLLNVWATWCAGCRDEHPLLVDLAESGAVPIFGINYKDQYRPALEWLHRYGDPYVTSGYDAEGLAGIDFGVYGLPETFVIDPDGNIMYKHVGPLDHDIVRDRILPIVREFEEGSG